MEFKHEHVRFFCETMRRNDVKATQCHEYLQNAWPEQAPTMNSVYRYYRDYAHGSRESFTDANRSGRPLTSHPMIILKKYANLFSKIHI